MLDARMLARPGLPQTPSHLVLAHLRGSQTVSGQHDRSSGSRVWHSLSRSPSPCCDTCAVSQSLRSALDAAQSRLPPFGPVPGTSWHRHGTGKGSGLCPALHAPCTFDIWTTRRWKPACGSEGLQLYRTFVQRARITNTEVRFATCVVRRLRSATFAARSLYICGYEVTLCMRDVYVELQAHARSRH